MYPITDRPRHRSGPPRPARRRPPGGIVLAGAHGGAGTSTLAALLAPAWDTGVISGPAAGGLRPGGRPVVLAARLGLDAFVACFGNGRSSRIPSVLGPTRNGSKGSTPDQADCTRSSVRP